MNNLILSISYIKDFAEPSITGLNWLVGQIIELVGSIGLGVILFTVILKLIMLPLDFFSRASMRKNSLKMEAMRPELEKLQKQYANDKNLYNQKMMALYKKEGYSMFGACLPTIVSLIIFIIVLNAFNGYSTYKNVDYIYRMSVSYNQVINDGIAEIDGYITKEGNKVVFDDDKIYTELSGESGNIGNLIVKYYEVGLQKRVDYKTVNGFAVFTKNINIEDGKKTYPLLEVNADVDALFANGNLKLSLTEGETVKEYTFSQYFEKVAENKPAETSEEEYKNQVAVLFLEEIQSSVAAKTFRETKDGFLWVKNIWVTDSAFAHPVYEKYSDFNSRYSVTRNNYNITESDYNALTSKLNLEKTEVNGYFILILLTALSSLLVQLVLSRSQKAQLELQSVNGQGAQTQKMMMWLMPIMLGVFAFLYTAAFSLYIIINSLMTLGTTLAINKFVDWRFAKQKEKIDSSKDKRYRKS